MVKQKTIKQRLKELQEDIEKRYYALCPLPLHWEQEILNIRGGFEKEFFETMDYLLREGAKSKKTAKQISKEMKEYEDLLKIKYMEFELEFYKSIQNE